jgi:acetyl esterase
MTLDSRAKALLDQANAMNATPLKELTPRRARSRMNVSSGLLGEPEPVALIEDAVVPSAAGRRIPVRLYRPEGPTPRPSIVYFHGGGWVTGSIATHDNLCRALANVTRALVVSVEYRLAPEHPFPAALEDAYEVTSWLSERLITLGVGSLAVAGDSAGGNLAAVVALMTRDLGRVRIDRQVLIYPILDYHFDTPSYHQNADGYLLSRDDMIWFWGHYLADPSHGEHPHASPLRAESLAGLPPTLLITAEYDPLRDEGYAYADRLMAAGVPTLHLGYDGMIHGFIRRLAVFPQARHALEEIATFLRQDSPALSPGPPKSSIR